MSSAAIAVVEGALSELREQRTLIVDELRITEAGLKA